MIELCLRTRENVKLATCRGLYRFETLDRVIDFGRIALAVVVVCSLVAAFTTFIVKEIQLEWGERYDWFEQAQKMYLLPVLLTTFFVFSVSMGFLLFWLCKQQALV